MRRTEAELNEYLAKAAGWRVTELGWTSGDNYYYLEPPAFTTDLSACVKWLGPLFRKIEMKRSSIGTSVKINTFEGQDFFSGLTLGDNAFARAFCRAAEQALDAGKETPCPVK